MARAHGGPSVTAWPVAADHVSEPPVRRPRAAVQDHSHARDRRQDQHGDDEMRQDRGRAWRCCRRRRVVTGSGWSYDGALARRRRRGAVTDFRRRQTSRVRQPGGPGELLAQDRGADQDDRPAWPGQRHEEQTDQDDRAARECDAERAQQRASRPSRRLHGRGRHGGALVGCSDGCGAVLGRHDLLRTGVVVSRQCPQQRVHGVIHRQRRGVQRWE